jgi:hypothetical protein
MSGLLSLAASLALGRNEGASVAEPRLRSAHRPVEIATRSTLVYPTAPATGAVPMPRSGEAWGPRPVKHFTSPSVNARADALPTPPSAPRATPVKSRAKRWLS